MRISQRQQSETTDWFMILSKIFYQLAAVGFAWLALHEFRLGSDFWTATWAVQALIVLDLALPG